MGKEGKKMRNAQINLQLLFLSSHLTFSSHLLKCGQASLHCKQGSHAKSLKIGLTWS
jgi:hypothetical protein